MSKQKSSKGQEQAKQDKRINTSKELGRLLADLLISLKERLCAKGCDGCELLLGVKKLVDNFNAEAAKADEKTKRKMKKSLRSTLREQLPDVLMAVLEEAKKGNCQHAKVLLEFVDAENLPDANDQQRSESLTELLLRKLDG